MSFRKFYSQAGQDQWVVRDVFDYKTSGYFLDIGAFDGIRLSNTYWLEKNLGWTGVCVEADPENFLALKKHRDCVCINACVGREGDCVSFIAGQGSCSGKKPTLQDRETPVLGKDGFRTVSLYSILKQTNAPATLDYMSLDVEGMEEEVMSTFPFDDYRFLCATIERPSSNLRTTLRNHGYLLVVDQPGLDGFYLHPDLAGSYMGRVMNRSAAATLAWPGRVGKFLSTVYKHGLRSACKRL